LAWRKVARFEFNERLGDLIRIFIEKGDSIAGAVDDPHNDQLGVREAVIDRVIAVKMDVKPLGEVVTVWPKRRMVAQRLKPLLDLVHEQGRSLGRVCRDESPDIGKVFFCLIGYAEGERSANFFLPRSIMRSASKS
jgi:hypothetical protein